VAVLLSNVTEIPSIEQLQERAVDAKENIEKQEQVRQAETEELLTDDDDVLDPI
jgi:hypothetical protein